jgi:predicted transglutaminase-like cysteine proteinase
MVLRRLIPVLPLLAGLQLATAAPALAAAGLSFVPTALIAAPLSLEPSCAGTPGLAMGETAPAAFGPAASKASAILGGQISRLEQIAQQQAGFAPSQLARDDSPALAGEGLSPGAGKPACLGFAASSFSPITRFEPGAARNPLGPEDFLASKRLPVSRTSFDKSWNRVRGAGLSKHLSAELTQAIAGQPGEARLAAVNAWTNANIRYAEDRELYGKADYWANAGVTLRRRAGDCEDIAIAKMQLLAAMGVERSDMFLVIARDLARNSDHAVLVVRQDGRHWLLDNATDQLLDAGGSFDYRPIMSFSSGQKWLHGY